MGYNLYITRKNDWFEEDDSNKIELSEWIEYIKSDNEIRLDNQASAITESGDIIVYENDGIAVWTSYSKNGLDGNYAWFNFGAGNISVKNPDEEIINKMVAIAKCLNAKVQGDEGEIYETKILTEDKLLTKNKGPWWKFWD